MLNADGREIGLVVTDLDNTLYDWVGSFVPAFYRMVDTAAELLDADANDLLDELKVVHQRHGSSEHPFALLETPLVQERLGDRSVEEQRRALDRAFHAFNSERKRALQLYEGVRETLLQLNRRRVPVVAHTDARVLNSLFRLMKLELVGLIDRLYAPEHQADELNSGHLTYDVPPGFVRLLPSEDRKPNPKTLADICSEYGVPAARTLYIGDSLSRDVYMARRAGAVAAWAKYGTRVEAGFWDKLVRVTHWNESDVEREQQLKVESADVHPDVELDRFSDILEHFTFGAWKATPSGEPALDRSA